jgi:hypothetical protein
MRKHRGTTMKETRRRIAGADDLGDAGNMVALNIFDMTSL